MHLAEILIQKIADKFKLPLQKMLPSNSVVTMILHNMPLSCYNSTLKFITEILMEGVLPL
jgi:hypothetical protein